MLVITFTHSEAIMTVQCGGGIVGDKSLFEDDDLGLPQGLGWGHLMGSIVIKGDPIVNVHDLPFILCQFL